jgi:branched-chain amino acid transport system substrate-binding protein
MQMRLLSKSAIAFALLLAASGHSFAAQECPVKIGMVMELSGPLAAVAKPIVDSAHLALSQINDNGGIKGCPAELLIRDSQGQPNLGVDAAKYLVDVDRVSALTGGLASGVALPVLVSVAVPSGLPFVACCSTAATFTKLAEEGKTNGMFFHLMAMVKTQAYTAAKAATDRGFKKIAVIYINGDFGVGLTKYFPAAMEKLGGSVTAMVPYNENQTSYRAEVNKALEGKPDLLFLAAYPQDGATITREWLSLGGTNNLLLHNALRNADYVKAVGTENLQSAFGYDNAPAEGPNTDLFREVFTKTYGYAPDGAGILPQYDALMVLALAMNIAPDLSGSAIRDSVRKVQVNGGTEVGTGGESYAKALALIKEGKPIKYVGATGPIEFDQHGDVAGPMLIWGVKGDTTAVEQTMTIGDINDIMKVVDQ